MIGAKRREGVRITYKKRLSADAKIIIALLRNQPQKRDDLCKNAGINVSTFYKVLPLLESEGIIKETEGGYALWFYDTLESKVREALDKLLREGRCIAVEALANEVGKPWSEIESITYAVVSKYDGLEIRTVRATGEKIIRVEPQP